ncbi:aminoglycoside phosphotransferase family protein [Maritalea sp.]|uniref:aminoglycoside phosphotransferase family protein n=1 Tax=Maritalea sp. TaxID=2003361 RepID=UPI003EFAA01D
MAEQNPVKFQIDVRMAQQLIAAQFPEWLDLPVTHLETGGTDNKLFRLGADKILRFPLSPSCAQAIEKEIDILPKFGGLGCNVPSVVAVGKPSDAFNASWAVYNWIEGKDCSSIKVEDLTVIAVDLAKMIHRLRLIAPDEKYMSGKQNHDRGIPLAELDHVAQNAINIVSDEFDSADLRHIWRDALDAPVFNGQPTWLHGDLHAGNLLVDEAGNLSGIIDFGLAGVGDPSVDLLPAWWLFNADGRQQFKTAMQVDEAEWSRGRGWALLVALNAYQYYRGSDKIQLTRMSRRAIVEILGE